jgi:hypothetical protein
MCGLGSWRGTQANLRILSLLSARCESELRLLDTHGLFVRKTKLLVSSPR